MTHEDRVINALKATIARSKEVQGILKQHHAAAIAAQPSMENLDKALELMSMMTRNGHDCSAERDKVRSMFTREVS